MVCPVYSVLLHPIKDQRYTIRWNRYHRQEDERMEIILLICCAAIHTNIITVSQYFLEPIFV